MKLIIDFEASTQNITLHRIIDKQKLEEFGALTQLSSQQAAAIDSVITRFLLILKITQKENT